MDVKTQETINQLKALALDGGSHENLSAICDVLYGGKPDFGWTVGACSVLREVLVGMLEQLDPTEWSNEYLDEVGLIRLSKDERGEVIHIGEELCGYGYPKGGVYCKAVVNERTILVGEDDEAYGDWLMWDAGDCRHHHRPTVESVLHEMVGEIMGFDDPFDLGAFVTEYAAKLREVIDND